MKKYFIILFFKLCIISFLFSQNYNENAGTIIIPNGTQEIKEYQFSDFKNLKTIIIPNSVKKIGREAFWGCTSLVNIELPESITEIGMYAFSGCKSLKSIKIPSKVTKLDSGTFFECESLEEVILPKDLKEISGGCGTYGAFNKCCSLRYIDSPIAKVVGDFVLVNGELSCTLRKRKKEYIIPDGCTIIPKSFFDSVGEYASTVIIIPESVKKIEEYAFSASQLKSITIPSTVNEIGDHAFINCDKLEKLVIMSPIIIDFKKIFDNRYDYSNLLTIVISKNTTIKNVPPYILVLRK
ncbi:MAG: leucine-rich repeat protein [Treponema sp.]|nr:leucine-rich repeat protein [Treponema sp.]